MTTPDLGPTEDRRIEYLVIDAIQSAKKNPKKHDIPGLIETMTQLGFGETPLLDERTGRLLAGHGRIEALVEMQKRKLHAPRGIRSVDDVWSIPVTRGYASESDEKAEAYLVSSNTQGVKGGWDGGELAGLLKGLADSGNLSGSGYDQTSLDALLRQVEEPHGEMMDPGDGGSARFGRGSVKIEVFRFGETQIPFSQEEAAEFKNLLDKYIAKTGSLFGFSRLMLGGIAGGL